MKDRFLKFIRSFTLRGTLNVILGIVLVLTILRIYTLNVSYSAMASPSQKHVEATEEADLLLVEFLQYGCGYCQSVHPSYRSALNQDRKVAYSPRPIALGNEDSRQAAILVYAAGEQGKFIQAHEFMINYPDISDSDLALKMAQALSLDLEKLLQDSATEEIIAQIENNENTLAAIGFYDIESFILSRSRVFLLPKKEGLSPRDVSTLFQNARRLS